MLFFIRIFAFPLFSNPLVSLLSSDIIYQEQKVKWKLGIQQVAKTEACFNVHQKRICCGAKSLTFSSHPSWDFQAGLCSASQWACLLWGSLQTCPVCAHRTHLSPGMSVVGLLWLIHLSPVGPGLTLQTMWAFLRLLLPAEASTEYLTVVRFTED